MALFNETFLMDTDKLHSNPMYNVDIEFVLGKQGVDEHMTTVRDDNISLTNHSQTAESPAAIIGISLFFCMVGIVGIIGNICILFIIACDKKMRNSVTNLFIMNLAVSDLLIMLFGIPDIVLFMLNRGWLLGETLCKIDRYILVVSLYSSVITLVSVCIERYIAIVHPIQAYVFCSRRRMILVIALIWPTVLLLSLHVAFFMRVEPLSGRDIDVCHLRFPGNHAGYLVIYKYIEFLLFYLIPMILQIVCYTIIGKKLFTGSEELHRKQIVVGHDGLHKEQSSGAMQARRGVVKMLIASVIIYFISYSPLQVILFYNTFSSAAFHATWNFLVLVTAMGYMNSAANPILYYIFSQNFRKGFRRIFLCRCAKSQHDSDVNLRYYLSTDNSVLAKKKSYLYSRVPGHATSSL